MPMPEVCEHSLCTQAHGLVLAPDDTVNLLEELNDAGIENIIVPRFCPHIGCAMTVYVTLSREEIADASRRSQA